LDANSIETIQERTFSGLGSLHTLLIYQNKIAVIPPRAFVDLKKLVVLDLSTNQINKIDDATFIGLVSLKSLKISGNKLTDLQAYTFGYLKQLEVLDLSGNFIEMVDAKAFVGLYKLKTLNLFNNKYSALPNCPNSIPPDTFSSYTRQLEELWLGSEFGQERVVDERLLAGLYYLKRVNGQKR
jgi:Leucine-rich repeat (LRR) protein